MIQRKSTRKAVVKRKKTSEKRELRVVSGEVISSLQLISQETQELHGIR